MIIYVDENGNCHASPQAGATAHNLSFFNGKAEAFIEGYVCDIQEGSMAVYPAKPYEELIALQNEKTSDALIELGVPQTTNIEKGVQTTRNTLNKVVATVPDGKVYNFFELFPTWKVGQTYHAEREGVQASRVRYASEDGIYKCLQTHTAQKNWTPETAPALWQRIDETHTGTKEDPIPYHVNMEVFANLFYTEDGILYRCIQNSGIPLQHPANALLGIYFALAE